MANFNGISCPICDKPFDDHDDVVVCPDCGAPYHRHCYQESGHCIMDDLHEKGELWRPPVDQSAAPDAVVCAHCGYENPPESLLCNNCGGRLAAPLPQNSGGQWQDPNSQWQPPSTGQWQGSGPSQNSQQAQWQQQSQQLPNIFDSFFRQGVNPNEEMADGVTYKEAGDFVGPNNLKFLMRFHMLQHGTNLTFNGSAFLFGPFYCFFRKMNKLGAILLSITMAVTVPTFVVAVLYSQQLLAVYGVEMILSLDIFSTLPVIEGTLYTALLVLNRLRDFVILGVQLYCGFMFNKRYMNHVIRQVRTLRSTCRHSTGSPEYCYTLVRSGGTTLVPVLVIIAAYFLLSFTLLFVNI